MRRKAITLATLLITLTLSSSFALAQASDLNFLNHDQPCWTRITAIPTRASGTTAFSVRSTPASPCPSSRTRLVRRSSHGNGRVVVSHTPHATGKEPTLEDYFFKQVTPSSKESSLKTNAANGRSSSALRLQGQPSPVAQAVLAGARQHEAWLSTAVKTSDPAKLSPIDRKPILVITEEADEQQKVFSTPCP